MGIFLWISRHMLVGFRTARSYFSQLLYLCDPVACWRMPRGRKRRNLDGNASHNRRARTRSSSRSEAAEMERAIRLSAAEQSVNSGSSAPVEDAMLSQLSPQVAVPAATHHVQESGVPASSRSTTPEANYQAQAPGQVQVLSSSVQASSAPVSVTGQFAPAAAVYQATKSVCSNLPSS